MIKKTITIFLALFFLLTKKIFVRENRMPHKIMDSFSNKLHSIFIFTSFFTLYLSWFEISINGFSINTIIYFLLFLQFVLIIRYFNPKMLEEKRLQSKIINFIKRFSLVIFILNWLVFSFGLAFLCMVLIFINYMFYVFIILQIKKQKEQAEFKSQFGQGNFSQEDIVKKHIINLFESDIALSDLSRNSVKKQYRLMAKKYHPDVYKGEEKDKFTSINLSYNYLLELVK